MGLLSIDCCEMNQTMERIVNISQDTPLKRQKEEDEGCDRVTVHKKSEERNTLEMLNGTTITGTSSKRQKGNEESVDRHEQIMPNEKQAKAELNLIQPELLNSLVGIKDLPPPSPPPNSDSMEIEASREDQNRVIHLGQMTETSDKIEEDHSSQKSTDDTTATSPLPIEGGKEVENSKNASSGPTISAFKATLTLPESSRNEPVSALSINGSNLMQEMTPRRSPPTPDPNKGDN